jgi:cytochrome c oxidase subunit IV
LIKEKYNDKIKCNLKYNNKYMKKNCFLVISHFITFLFWLAAGMTLIVSIEVVWKENVEIFSTYLPFILFLVIIASILRIYTLTKKKKFFWKKCK